MSVSNYTVGNEQKNDDTLHTKPFMFMKLRRLGSISNIFEQNELFLGRFVYGQVTFPLKRPLTRVESAWRTYRNSEQEYAILRLRTDLIRRMTNEFWINWYENRMNLME